MSLPHAHIRSETSGLQQPSPQQKEQQRIRHTKLLPPLSPPHKEVYGKIDAKEPHEIVLPRRTQLHTTTRKHERSMSNRPQTAHAHQNSSTREYLHVAENPRQTISSICGTDILSCAQKSQFESFERDKRQSIILSSSSAKVRSTHIDLSPKENRPHSAATHTPRSSRDQIPKSVEHFHPEGVFVSHQMKPNNVRKRSQSASIDSNSTFPIETSNIPENKVWSEGLNGIVSDMKTDTSVVSKEPISVSPPGISHVTKVPKLDISFLNEDSHSHSHFHPHPQSDIHPHPHIHSPVKKQHANQVELVPHKPTSQLLKPSGSFKQSQSQSFSGSMTAREAVKMLSHALQRENTDAHIVEVVKTEHGTVERRLADDEPIDEHHGDGRELVLRNSAKNKASSSEVALKKREKANNQSQRKLRQLQPKEQNEPSESSSTDAISTISPSSSQSLVQEKVFIDVTRIPSQSPLISVTNIKQSSQKALNINLNLVNTTLKELSAEQVEQSGLLTVRKKDKTPRNGQTVQHSVVGRKNKNLSLVQILYFDSNQEKTMQNYTDKFAFFASLPTATLGIEKDCDVEDVIDSVIEENLFDISDYNPSNYILYEVTIESVNQEEGFALKQNKKGVRELSLSDIVFEWMKKWDEETNLHFKFVLGMKKQRAPSFTKTSKDKSSDSEKTIVIDYASGKSDNILWIPESELTFTGKVSSGTYARVYTAKYHDKTVAVKVLKGTLDTTTIKEFQKEFAIFKKTNHENLVHFYGACFNTKLSLVMEYCERNSLVHLMMSASFDFAWEHFFKFGKQMFRGLEYLHNFEPQIIHRDLKSLNLLVTRDLDIRITDFGLSRYNTASNNATLNNLCGTMSHCAPEIYLGERFTTKSDIYSGAMILWEMVTRLLTGSYSQPYAEYSWIAFDFQIIIQTAQNGLRPSFPESIDDRVRQIISAGWSSDHNQRPDASQMREVLEVLESKW